MEEQKQVVLTVDDEQCVHGAYRRVLSPGNFEFLQAADGAQAVPLIEERRPSAIITDGRMIRMFGDELLTYLRRERIRLYGNKSPSVALVTGTPDLEFVGAVDLYGSGARLFTKPFDSDPLREYLLSGLVDKVALPALLVVDDMAENYTAYRNFLSTDRFNFAYARDGEEGLRLIRRLKPDYVILDGRMPGKSGDEVLSELVDDEFKPKVVLASGTLDEEMERTARLYGNAICIEKDGEPSSVQKIYNYFSAD